MGLQDARCVQYDLNYTIDLDINGKALTKTAKTRMVGNSVSPPAACAIVRYNYTEIELEKSA